MTRNSKSKSSKGKKIAVIPCFNEDTTIGSIVIKSKKYVDCVIVVDDGSVDDTKSIAGDAGAIVVSNSVNRGKTAAIKTGFQYALDHGFDTAVTLDGDGQHNPDEIPLLLKGLIDGGNDIALGSRAGKRTEMPLWRKFGKRVLDYSTSFANGKEVTDSQCGFRAFNRHALEVLTPYLKGNGFSVESKQLIYSAKFGLKMVNIPIHCRYNGLFKTSNSNSASHGFSVFRYLVWLVAEERPLLFIGVPGFIFVVIGLFLGILTLQYYNLSNVFLIHYAILVSIFLIVGVIAMFIGLILSVLPKIIEKTNRESDHH